MTKFDQIREYFKMHPGSSVRAAFEPLKGISEGTIKTCVSKDVDRGLAIRGKGGEITYIEDEDLLNLNVGYFKAGIVREVAEILVDSIRYEKDVENIIRLSKEIRMYLGFGK